MGVNTRLVQSIKRSFSEQPSDELRKMLEERDQGQYSEEAFVAAQEILEERTSGRSVEPVRREPPREPTPEERLAASDALLRRQIRLIGLYYYFLACIGLLVAQMFVFLAVLQSSFQFVLISAFMIVPFATTFWFLGWALWRFSPAARVAAIILSFLQMPGFPIGTCIGLYCFDKLMRADHLFGGKPHPGEKPAVETGLRKE